MNQETLFLCLLKSVLQFLKKNDINKHFRVPGLDSTFCNPGTAV